jgi:hypothetical protein
MKGEIQRQVVNFENAFKYGVQKGGPKVVFSWTKLEKVIAYFLSNGSKHVAGGQRKPL